MGTVTLTNRTAGQTITADFFNDIHSAISNELVGRNGSGIATAGQSLGTNAIPWGNIYANSLILNGASVDTSQITSLANRIDSGKTRTLSEAPDFLRASGSSLSFEILGESTTLALSINGASVGIDTDIEVTGLTAAPSSNNTANVNDVSMTNSLYAGEDGSVIEIDAVGTEITSRVGQVAAFLTPTGEIIRAFIRDNTTLTNVNRGFYFDNAGSPIPRGFLSNNDTLTLLQIGYVFVENNGTTVEVAYRSPTTSNVGPASPVTGDYWFDIPNQTWKRWGGSSWNIINREILGEIVTSTTACIGTRSRDFYRNFKSDNNGFVVKKSEEIIEFREVDVEANVYGNSVRFYFKKTEWNMTTDLDSGVEANDTVYYAYLTEKGQRVISTIKPYERKDLQGFYHPYESWRCLATFLNNTNGDIEQVHQVGKIIDNFVGVCFDIATEEVPENFLSCDGSSLKRSEFPELFNAIGTRYGSLNAETFNLPDRRGRYPKGWDNGAGTDLYSAIRTAMNTGGATADSLGSVQGDTTRRSTQASMTTNTDSHAHTFNRRWFNESSGGSYVWGINGSSGGAQGTSTDSHNHSVSGGGDLENNTKNFNAHWVIKYR